MTLRLTSFLIWVISIPCSGCESSHVFTDYTVCSPRLDHGQSLRWEVGPNIHDPAHRTCVRRAGHQPGTYDGKRSRTTQDVLDTWPGASKVNVICVGSTVSMPSAGFRGPEISIPRMNIPRVQKSTSPGPAVAFSVAAMVVMVLKRELKTKET